MFRPTHFVILFAVFLCAYAAPAAKESPAVEPAVKALEPKKVDKSDLATDATTYLRFIDGSLIPTGRLNAPILTGESIDWIYNDYGQLVPRIFYGGIPTVLV